MGRCSGLSGTPESAVQAERVDPHLTAFPEACIIGAVYPKFAACFAMVLN